MRSVLLTIAFLTLSATASAAEPGSGGAPRPTSRPDAHSGHLLATFHNSNLSWSKWRGTGANGEMGTAIARVTEKRAVYQWQTKAQTTTAHVTMSKDPSPVSAPALIFAGKWTTHDANGALVASGRAHAQIHADKPLPSPGTSTHVASVTTQAIDPKTNKVTAETVAHSRSRTDHPNTQPGPDRREVESSPTRVKEKSTTHNAGVTTRTYSTTTIRSAKDGS